MMKQKICEGMQVKYSKEYIAFKCTRKRTSRV
jgi:hypothetical protein